MTYNSRTDIKDAGNDNQCHVDLVIIIINLLIIIIIIIIMVALA